jgi:hypothetical protein
MLAKIEHARQMEDRTRSEFVRQAIRVYLAQAEPEARVYDAAGAVGESDGLDEETKPDGASGRVKDAAAKVVDRVREAIREAKDRI